VAFVTVSPPTLSNFRLAIAGAGVLGLGVAALAAAEGARVTVFDPRPPGDNASGVAAGMLAPALEAALEGEADAYALLRKGFEAWPAFAAAIGLAPPDALHAGALYLDGAAGLERVARRLQDLGAPAERLTADAARKLQPRLAPGATEALRVVDDGRVDPRHLLQRLLAGVIDGGGEVVRAPAPERAEGFDAVVIAAGYGSRRWVDAAPGLAALQPIKGHVLHFDGGPTAGPTLRTPAGYAAPQAGGVVFGATMEPGRADLDVDPATVRRLHTAAVGLLPELAGASFRALTGVRAAFPDGRPRAGPVGDRLHLATGARRNGWLIAPLVARAVVRGLQGAPKEAVSGLTLIAGCGPT
jgi:glycine oxidase